MLASVWEKAYRKSLKDRYLELKAMGFCEDAAIEILAEEIKAIATEEDKRPEADIDHIECAKRFAGYFYPS